MASKAQRHPHGLGVIKGPWGHRTQNLKAGSSFKRTQISVKLAPRFHGLDP